MEATSSNKRIARNTLFLYARMLLLLVISLFTSRVVLQTLGVHDYGTYNVVFGTVVLFSFVSMSLTTGTQRHISYELGRADGDVPKMFSACLHVHMFAAFLVLALAETVGLWFLNTQMVFPEGRLPAVNIIYQIAIFTCAISISLTPYTSALIAYERMSFYAYYGIVDAALKLAVVFALTWVAYDKLILYGWLQFGVVLIMSAALVSYCHRNIAGVRFKQIADKGIYRYLLSFSGWTLFGSIAGMMETQGLNMLVNIFYGVAVNAAVGVSNQVRNAVNQFVTGFQQALNPQLVMSQSGGDKARQLDLIFKSSKFSFLIFYMLGFPLIVRLDAVLQLWLGTVPPYTCEIVVLAIIVQLFDCLSSPLYTTIFAVGRIKGYQLTVSAMRMASVAAAFVICECAMPPYTIYVVPCLVALALVVYRLRFVSHSIGMPIGAYAKSVLRPVAGVLLATLLPLCVFRSLATADVAVWVTLVEIAVSATLNMAVISFIGFNASERRMMVGLVKKKLNHSL